MRGVAIALVGCAFSACSGGSQPSPAEHTIAPTAIAHDAMLAGAAIPLPDAASADAAVFLDVATLPIRDETAPATRVFVPSTGRMLSGATRATWPMDLPEMPWLNNSFTNLSLDSYDGTRVTGTVELYAAPGLDPNKCTVELLWGLQSKSGVQLAHPPTIEHPNDPSGAHAIWRFRSPIAGKPSIASAITFAFCPNDVTFTSIEMFSPGPATRDAYCKTTIAATRPGEGMIGRNRTFDLMFACGALIRLRGRDLVDDCRGDTLLSLDALGPDITAVAPAAGSQVTDEEIRHWSAGGSWCSEVHLASKSSFPDSARAPFAAFAKRAGGRLVSANSRDGMIEP